MSTESLIYGDNKMKSKQNYNNGRGTKQSTKTRCDLGELFSGSPFFFPLYLKWRQKSQQE